MFCKWCASEIPDDVHVCPRCGEALSKEEEISIKALNIEDNLDDLESEFLEIVGKDIVFKDIEPKYPNSKETYQAPKSSTPEKLAYSGRAITAMITTGSISGILVLVGIFMFLGSFGQGVAVIGLTLAVIGFLVLFCILTAASKGKCFVCCTGC